VIRLGTPQSAGENFACTLEHLGAPATTLGAPVTSLGAPTTSLGALIISPGASMTSLGAPTTSLGGPMTSLGELTTCLGAPRITVEQSGKNGIFRNVAGAPENHSYYLPFNDL